MGKRSQILSDDLLPEYLQQIPDHLQTAFDALHDADLSTDSFSFYTSVSAVFSSKIEGENIELDSYVKHKRFGIEFLPDYTKKIDDLYAAYSFAHAHPLNAKHISEAHQLLSKNIVAESQQGTFRHHNMYVSTPDGRIEYVASSPFIVSDEMQRLYNDIDYLLQQPLTIQEVFFYASFIHLVFVKIHPWNDGNGRSGRLIEKWFLAEKLGAKAWFLQSEKNYYQHHQMYYNNLRLLGLEYEQLDYSKALPFLLMLPASLQTRASLG